MPPPMAAARNFDPFSSIRATRAFSATSPDFAAPFMMLLAVSSASISAFTASERSSPLKKSSMLASFNASLMLSANLMSSAWAAAVVAELGNGSLDPGTFGLGALVVDGTVFVAVAGTSFGRICTSFPPIFFKISDSCSRVSFCTFALLVTSLNASMNWGGISASFIPFRYCPNSSIDFSMFTLNSSKESAFFLMRSFISADSKRRLWSWANS